MLIENCHANESRINTIYLFIHLIRLPTHQKVTFFCRIYLYCRLLYLINKIK